MTEGKPFTKVSPRGEPIKKGEFDGVSIQIIPAIQDAHFSKYREYGYS